MAVEAPYQLPARVPDLRRFWDIFWRRFPLFLLIFGVILAAGIAYARLTPKIYVATAAVTIEPRKGDPVQPNGTPPPEAAPSPDYIDTQIVVVAVSPDCSAGCPVAQSLR